MPPASGHISSTPRQLNRVWNSASVVATEGSSDRASLTRLTSSSTVGRIRSATTPVSTLKNTCAAATRRALGVALMTARMAVEVVPTLAPITTAAAASSPIVPLAAAVRASAMAALDDCTHKVSRKPSPT